ncbi:hypothetical protein [Mesorhizobium sp. B4-1-1]|uniref:hypothetical protein n=1 Tax=Mesorhizobium sp. B4-1-1 TaxID=2589890 RepID=UPI00112AE6FE|nr:hypothetical protein [Mesorhizobium sp. B4-1-1]TPI19418.1 hypothetical protein FJW10_14820 [Mesorhizobium sp. B4-1-1]
MNNFMGKATAIGRRYAHAFAAVALVSMVSGCQSMDTMKTASLSIKPATHMTGKKVYHLKKQRLPRIHRKPLTQTTSVTRVREEAYAAYVRTQRVRLAGPVRISYSPGSVGPLLGHSPWICGPSGFGQHSACRAR